MKKRKIYVVGGSNGYANWMEGELTGKMMEADLVLFTGGEDVTPSLYNEPAHPETYSNIHRDLREKAVFEQAVDLNKHIIGICRGGQFVCVASGGKLVQHQQNPSFMHDIITHDGKTLSISSTHHQAQFPWNMPATLDNFKILAWTEGISKFHFDGNGQEIVGNGIECEIVYYPETKALGIQGHPEMMFDPEHPTIIYLRDLLDKHMKDAIV